MQPHMRAARCLTGAGRPPRGPAKTPKPGRRLVEQIKNGFHDFGWSSALAPSLRIVLIGRDRIRMSGIAEVRMNLGPNLSAAVPAAGGTDRPHAAIEIDG